VGARALREMQSARPPTRMVRRGHVKVMIDEATSDPADIRSQVVAAHAAGQPVALHAVSETELVVALHALRDAPPGPPRWAPDRIEHAAVVPDTLLEDVLAARVSIVGQPALVYTQGDRYRADYPSEQHGWLHRAGSMVAAGIPYAASSDAPVTPPDPQLMLFAARRRLTRGGQELGPAERLDFEPALESLTAAPARLVGAWPLLGVLRAGALADVAVLDPDVVQHPSRAPDRPVRMTLKDGRLVWRR
jgi:predicted amidohydrolase YtcJ